MSSAIREEKYMKLVKISKKKKIENYREYDEDKKNLWLLDNN